MDRVGKSTQKKPKVFFLEQFQDKPFYKDWIFFIGIHLSDYWNRPQAGFFLLQIKSSHKQTNKQTNRREIERVTRARRRFLGLWNFSQSLSFAKSSIFLLRRSRVTLSCSAMPCLAPVIFRRKSQKNRMCI